MRPLKALRLVFAAIAITLILVKLWMSNRARPEAGRGAPADTTCMASKVGLPCR